jgi:hypothetical protein
VGQLQAVLDAVQQPGAVAPAEVQQRALAAAVQAESNLLKPEPQPTSR